MTLLFKNGFQPLRPEISDSKYLALTKFVRKTYGINLTEVKRVMVANRLTKRLKETPFDTIESYLDYIFSSRGIVEREVLSDILSTNKTYFFRERAHYEFFKKYLEEIRSFKNLSIWSAASSSGDEVYSLSILLNEYLEIPINQGISYNILGTDISGEMLEAAKMGVYTEDRVAKTPKNYIMKYFDVESGGFNKKNYLIKNSLRKNIVFKKFNLIQDFDKKPGSFDFIFCRNVLIYFEQHTKEKVVNDLASCLKPGGYLILAHCEGTLGRSTNLIPVQPSVFQKPMS